MYWPNHSSWLGCCVAYENKLKGRKGAGEVESVSKMFLEEIYCFGNIHNRERRDDLLPRKIEAGRD